ncbi:L-cysteine desulfidase family protein [Bifidobacterium xylocopae]|uniref:UPF0597 protein CRD59_03825 n=1 Tax=Bifidobacterium xylocopae TaxID=2493119 RepID=A0A366KDN2_9BIFI|nr:L-serine ammonia-lyase, iron-sulfur-dependent, subunit alpha [Bifidobacterium xylocopae]RBP99342.1 hypothetical protein CRD59_03825 [Bifidobacterium xylocopae]
MIQSNEGLFIQALRENVLPATGCTEPVAVAYAAANAIHMMGDRTVGHVRVSVSPNIMKNALAVIVPGTGEPGLKIAAAAGIVSGRYDAGLKVISDIRPEDVQAIKDLAASGRIDVEVAPYDDDLYVEVEITNGTEDVTIFIAGDHTNIFKIVRNGEVVKEDERPAAHEVSPVQQALQECRLRQIWDFALDEPLERITFMDEAGKLNMALAEEGLKHEYGLKLGMSMNRARAVNFGSGVDADISTEIVAYASAASDARMGGATLPAMSNSGSGNQGISATVPVCVVARHYGATDEQRIRALTLSHLTAIYIHAFLPILGPFCATDSAAMGAAAGIVYLLGKDYDTAAVAINNMAGDAAGMVCDGAGCSCAMKVATSASSMYRSVNLALQGVAIPASNGMVCPDVDQTIRGIGHLGTEGMASTDPVVLDIMMNKQ